MEKLFAKYLQYPKTVLLICLVIFFLVSYGATRLVFSSNYRIFFSEQNPHLHAFEDLQNTYTKNDNVLFVLSPKSGKVFEHETLLAIQALTEAAWQLPFSIRVDSVTNYQHTSSQGDELIVEDLVENPLSLSSEALDKARLIAIQEPLLVHRLISSKADVTGVNVTVQLPGKNDAVEVPVIAKAAISLKETFQSRFPDIEFRLTGVVMQNQAFSDASVSDSQTLLPLMFIAIFLGVALLFKSVLSAVIVMVVVILSVLPALGLAGWFGFTINSATLAAPIMIMTLAVADSVHLLSNFFLAYKHKSQKREALLHSIQLNLKPIFLTSVTTVLGFLSFNFSDAPPFRQLGNIVAMGVIWAFIFSLTVLPALMVLLPLKVRPTLVGQSLTEALGRCVVQFRTPIFWGVSLVVAVSICFIPRNELNDVWVDYFSPKLEFRQNADYTLKHLTGISTLNYSLKANGAEGISEPIYLQKVEDFALWLKQQPEVIQISTITDTFKRLNKSLHSDDDAFYKLPANKQLAAQYLLLYELSLPYGLDLNNQVNIDKSATRVQVVLRKVSTNELLNIEERIQAYQKEHFPLNMHSAGTSPDVMFAYIGFTNIRSMLMGTTIALILISVMLIFAFRSVKYGLLSLLPNLLPVGIAFGLWGFFIGEVGLSLSVVTGMTLGIIVDDTIHFMSKYLYARKTHPPQEAVQYAFHMVGRALMVTTVVLVVGFGILSFSSFKLNATMGLLTAITILIALAVDLLFLPALLMKFSKDKS